MNLARQIFEYGSSRAQWFLASSRIAMRILFRKPTVNIEYAIVTRTKDVSHRVSVNGAKIRKV
jgi:hypothetical protein